MQRQFTPFILINIVNRVRKIFLFLRSLKWILWESSESIYFSHSRCVFKFRQVVGIYFTVQSSLKFCFRQHSNIIFIGRIYIQVYFLLFFSTLTLLKIQFNKELKKKKNSLQGIVPYCTDIYLMHNSWCILVSVI